jgi:hypothetical protein
MGARCNVEDEVKRGRRELLLAGPLDYRRRRFDSRDMHS